VRSRIILALVLVLIAVAGAVTWRLFSSARDDDDEKLRLAATRFVELPGWKTNDASAALAAFRRSCVKILALPTGTAMAYAGAAGDWRPACERAAGAHDARGFFEGAFTPYAIGDTDGLVTGYYEPLLNGSRTRHGAYQTPVYGLPDDLVGIDLGRFNPEWKGMKLTGRLDGRRLLPFPSRAEIDAVPLKTRVLFYGDDPVAVFFLHIQGSGRVWLDDGTNLRVNYAGQNGQPYTPIGRTLIRNYGVPREGMSMQVIAAWLKAHPGEARKVMESDASFVFFEERPVGDAALGPEGTQGVALTPKGSVAVDAHVHPFGAPVYIAGEGLANLFVAQDTGGAIQGAARADIFFGFGAGAEASAGTLKAQARFYVLLPRGVTPKLAP
jgi:membrane-bound lytic murein transglycosylase A